MKKCGFHLKTSDFVQARFKDSNAKSDGGTSPDMPHAGSRQGWGARMQPEGRRTSPQLSLARPPKPTPRP